VRILTAKKSLTTIPVLVPTNGIPKGNLKANSTVCWESGTLKNLASSLSAHVFLGAEFTCIIIFHLPRPPKVFYNKFQQPHYLQTFFEGTFWIAGV
jgi:hypothetical protein